LIEDDLDDIELLEGALVDNHINCSLDVVYDGSTAIEYIKYCVSCPDIIILDFNLPKYMAGTLLKP